MALGVINALDIKDLIKISKVKKLKFEPVDLTIVHTDGGIYRMFSNTGEVIYVGKSGNLHKRILAHVGLDTHIKDIMHEVKRIEWLIEANPIFQSLLETIFIAFHKPKYNDEVKDYKKKFGEVNE
jgi:excinuclease UvrABC nuclease subunit